jgi:hypothetical protein
VEAAGTVRAGYRLNFKASHYTLPQWLNYSGAIIVAGILFIGPIFASIIGVSVVFAAGIYFVFKRRKTPSPATHITP